MNRKTLAASCAALSVLASLAADASAQATRSTTRPAAKGAPSVVKVVETAPGHYQLTRNGEAFFIRGVGGSGPKDVLKARGGNSFRTWSYTEGKKEFADADRYGLAVSLGYWVRPENQGLSYKNQRQLDEQLREVEHMVALYKDEPNLLIWSIGNEMEMGTQNLVEMWQQVNRLCKRVKELDPNHPTMVIVAEITPEKVGMFNRYCPDVDILGINSYGGSHSIPERYRECGGVKPYILTEYGPPATWETSSNAFGCPYEMSSTQKGEWYASVYKKTLEDKGKLCLGSYAFTWSHKVEATPTWFGMMLPDNTELAPVEDLQLAWGVTKPTNRVPTIEHMEISHDQARSEDDVITATVKGSDPDGDPLTWKWVVVQEASFYGVTGTGAAMPLGFPEAIIEGQGTTSVKVKLPGGGKYRLYAYCFDGNNHAAYVNRALLGVGKTPTIPAPKASLPCYVYKPNDMNPRWYPSGFMGNSALKLDLNETKAGQQGEACIRVDYGINGDWAGVYWQSPANDWGDQPGGYDLTGARTLCFRARGAKGGEKVTFFYGGLFGKTYSDSSRGEIKEEVLAQEWNEYRIPLEGRNMTRIKTGFGFTLGGQGAPLTFYIDGIWFE